MSNNEAEKFKVRAANLAFHSHGVWMLCLLDTIPVPPSLVLPLKIRRGLPFAALAQYGAAC